MASVQPSAKPALPEPDLFEHIEPRPEKRRAPVKEMQEKKTLHAFKTISEAARLLALPQHVLRFWETKFNQLKPLKLKGGRRYYRPQDVETLLTIKHLLYKQGYTIRGARKAFAQARKAKDVMQKSTSTKAKPRKPAPDMHDTPLFKMLDAPEKPADVQDRRKSLQSIHDELLRLREAARELMDA